MANKSTAKDKSLRTIVKATTWRILATGDTIMLSYIIYGNVGTALKIGLTEVLTKIVLFYIHERYLWSNIKLGRTYAADGKTVTGDKHYRSIIKGTSWRFFGTLDTILIAVFWTGQVAKALTVGSAEIITKITLFWLHERLWFKIKWGQPKEMLEAKNNGTIAVTLVNVEDKKEVAATV